MGGRSLLLFGICVMFMHNLCKNNTLKFLNKSITQYFKIMKIYLLGQAGLKKETSMYLHSESKQIQVVKPA